MGIFDSIEKLITEHGSAAIIRERLALASDQYAALERQLARASTPPQLIHVQARLMGHPFPLC